MKITRTINGMETEIELTHSELMQSYREVRAHFRKCELEDVAENLGIDITSEKIDDLVPKYQTMLTDAVDKIETWWYIAEHILRSDV